MKHKNERLKNASQFELLLSLFEVINFKMFEVIKKC